MPRLQVPVDPLPGHRAAGLSGGPDAKADHGQRIRKVAVWLARLFMPGR